MGLQIKEFGEFVDTMQSARMDSKFYQAAASLLQAMSGTFSDEAERSKHFQEIICTLSENFHLDTDSQPNYKSNLTVNSMHATFCKTLHVTVRFIGALSR